MTAKMNYKNWMLAIAISVFSVIALQAQGPYGNRGDKEKIEAMKVGFITGELNLTTEEAQQFWPVYNQLEAERKKLDKAERDLRMKLKEDLDNLTDKELEATITGEFDIDQQEVELERKYFEELKKVLPLRKVGMLYKAEKEFKWKILKELHKKQDDHSGPHGGH